MKIVQMMGLTLAFFLTACGSDQPSASSSSAGQAVSSHSTITEIAKPVEQQTGDVAQQGAEKHEQEEIIVTY